MWLKRENDDEAVQLDFVQSILRYAGSEYYIKFYQRDSNCCIFRFKNEKELNEYYEGLMSLLEAQEVNPIGSIQIPK